MYPFLSLRWAACNCWLSKNIFIPNHQLHVEFNNENDFDEKYSKLFQGLGFSSESYSEIREAAKVEHERRRGTELSSLWNKWSNLRNYTPLSNRAFVLTENDLDPIFIRLREASGDDISSYMTFVECVDGLQEVYRFPVLSQSCLDRINRELDHLNVNIERKSRPNTMNYAGMLLSEIPGSQASLDSTDLFDPGGADIDVTDSLLAVGMLKILKRLFPQEADILDSYRTFTVEYALPDAAGGKDLALSAHYDNSEITVNVCLRLSIESSQIDGGQLFFVNKSPHEPYRDCDSSDEFAKLLDHRPGWAIVHRGSHVHGVLPFTQKANVFQCSPDRRSLICWLRSSTLRSHCCPRCCSFPKLVPMKVLSGGLPVDITSLPDDDVRAGRFVRTGFADGFLLPGSVSTCSTA